MQLQSSLILLALTVALHVFNVHAQEAEARITKYENENNGLGEYNFNFQTSNNIERSESGKLEDDGNFVVNGFYSFLGADGKKYFVTYVADKTGYHPTVITGDVLPQITVQEEAFALPPMIASSPPGNIVATLLG